jgi:hypothetical protein
MSHSRVFCIVVLILRSAALAGGQTVATSPEVAQPDACWLIKETGGTWQYREPPGEEKLLTGKYDCLRPNGELRCMEKDVGRCTLRYLVDPHANRTESFPVKVQQAGRWISLKRSKMAFTVLSPPSAELVKKLDTLGQHARPGGSKSSSACGGDLVLKAPVCGEYIDISDFTIRWPGGGDDNGKSMSVVVERVDGHEALFRDVVATTRHEYATDKLLDFLKKQQGRNDPVDVTVRVMAGNGRQAVRLVHVPSFVQTGGYNQRVKELEPYDPLWRSLQLISFAMDEGMWSRAAEETRRLLDLAPHLKQLQAYALAGFCQSDFEEEKSALRTEMPKDRYESICGVIPGGGPGGNGEGTEPAAARVEPAKQAAGNGTRLGIALLIGNSDYWNLPLSSVKSDVQGMSEALASLGFRVNVKENLRGPKEFQDALRDVLKTENASPDDILLLYYSGHGLQLDGKAHLLGTGISTSARVAEDVRSNAQSAEGLLAEMETAVPGTRILIVDACRNNLFTAPSAQGGQSPRAGFAFQQDDVPNTFVMFANRPGLPTPARSEYGLMGPFTESLIYSLQKSSGEIQEVFALAEKKTREISPGQDPVLYTSKNTDHVILRLHEREGQIDRAAALLNGAEIFYTQQAWDQFRAIVDRARVLAMDLALQQRLNREVEFVRLVIAAQGAEAVHDWKQAAIDWQKSYEIFPVRRWLAMKAAMAWLMADDLSAAVLPLASLSAEREGQLPLEAKQILSEMVKAFPDLEAAAKKTAGEATKPSGREFETVGDKE